MPKLVIVESPAKAKTIGKYLGRGYKVTASMGHVRDLPASTLGIDVENGYTPKYITIKGKQKLVKELKAEAKKCDGVLLATDPDREGEAISWHLANILGLDPAAPNRVTFDEITKKGVKEGMAHPRAINIDLFNAQQARRELDRLVGYKLSPFLWRKVRKRPVRRPRAERGCAPDPRPGNGNSRTSSPTSTGTSTPLLHAQGDKSEFTARLAATADGKKLTVDEQGPGRRHPGRAGRQGLHHYQTLKKASAAASPRRPSSPRLCSRTPAARLASRPPARCAPPRHCTKAWTSRATALWALSPICVLTLCASPPRPRRRPRPLLRTAGARITSARPPASGRAVPPPPPRTPTKPFVRLCRS